MLLEDRALIRAELMWKRLKQQIFISLMTIFIFDLMSNWLGS